MKTGDPGLLGRGTSGNKGLFLPCVVMHSSLASLQMCYLRGDYSFDKAASVYWVAAPYKLGSGLRGKSALSGI